MIKPTAHQSFAYFQDDRARWVDSNTRGKIGTIIIWIASTSPIMIGPQWMVPHTRAHLCGSLSPSWTTPKQLIRGNPPHPSLEEHSGREWNEWNPTLDSTRSPSLTHTLTHKPTPESGLAASSSRAFFSGLMRIRAEARGSSYFWFPQKTPKDNFWFVGVDGVVSFLLLSWVLAARALASRLHTTTTMKGVRILLVHPVLGGVTGPMSETPGHKTSFGQEPREKGPTKGRGSTAFSRTSRENTYVRKHIHTDI